ncbi:MAG: flavohemoglobin expression-modulating QEGLA motif protein [Gemmataceae bacterium]
MIAVSEADPPLSTRPKIACTIQQLSARLAAAQRSIRPLDAVAWGEDVERRFLSHAGRELPAVDRDYYLSRPLPFQPDRKLNELADLERDVERTLGSRDGAGRILKRMCREYAGLVHMLAYRGTATFAMISAKLFGTARSAADGLRALDAMSRRFPAALCDAGPACGAGQAMLELSLRLGPNFPDWHGLRIKLVDDLIADAAAGSSYLKLRRSSTFTSADLRQLEVHEGWIHLGTSYNARHQPVCSFLRKGPPSSTRTQEGLAVFAEFLAGVAVPERVRRLKQRVAGIHMAEEGADFCQVYRFFRETEADEREAYQQTARVFRGSRPAGCGPFTKDLCYVSGLGDVLAWLTDGGPDAAALVPLLFCGKVAVEDIPTLAELHCRGWLESPLYVPAPFRDGNALAGRLTR